MEDTQPEKKFNPMLIIGGIVLLAIIGLGVMFANNNTTPGQTNTTTPPVAETNETQPESNTSPVVEGEQDNEAEVGEVQVIEVEAGSFYFKPNELRVKKGQTVRITMSSADMMHDFVIDELDVKMPVVQSGNTGTVEFTANEAGEFEYYCSVGQHRQMGQVGTLIVEE